MNARRRSSEKWQDGDSKNSSMADSSSPRSSVSQSDGTNMLSSGLQSEDLIDNQGGEDSLLNLKTDPCCNGTYSQYAHQVAEATQLYPAYDSACSSAVFPADHSSTNPLEHNSYECDPSLQQNGMCFSKPLQQQYAEPTNSECSPQPQSSLPAHMNIFNDHPGMQVPLQHPFANLATQRLFPYAKTVAGHYPYLPQQIRSSQANMFAQPGAQQPETATFAETASSNFNRGFRPHSSLFDLQRLASASQLDPRLLATATELSAGHQSLRDQALEICSNMTAAGYTGLGTMSEDLAPSSLAGSTDQDTCSGETDDMSNHNDESEASSATASRLTPTPTSSVQFPITKTEQVDSPIGSS